MLSNKFHIPHLSPFVLHRARLVDDILLKTVAGDNGAPFPLKVVLVHSPAGYGKTTLLADFGRNTDLPCCWYFLNEDDLDQARFLQGIVESIRGCFPQFGQALDALITHSITADLQSPTNERSFLMVIEKLALTIEKELTQNFVLILSNYHIVNAHPGVNRIVQHLLQHLPSRCLLILESRAIPDLNLPLLFLHSELLVIGADKLEFTAQEVYDLARHRGIEQVEQQDAEQLTERFSGWITGILLDTYFGDIQFLSPLHDLPDSQSSLTEPLKHRQLVNYIFSEIFKSENDLFTFLQEVSLLSSITPDLCNKLLEISDAEQRLLYIERQGLFLTRGWDSSSSVYLCHPVLRELFHQELREHNPARFFHLHRRAAEIFQEQGELSQAISHAIQAEEYRFAARMTASVSQHLLVQGYSETIAGWIDSLPPDIVREYPQLLLARAHIFLLLHQANDAFPLLEKALELIVSPEEQYPSKLQAELLIAQGVALFHKGDYQQAQELCEQAIDLLQEGEQELLALAHQRLGICLSAMGNCQDGIVHLHQALKLWGHQTLNRQVAFLYGQLAKSYNLLSNYALAEYHYTRALYCWEQLEDLQGKTRSLIGVGMVHFRQGSYHQGETFLNQALALCRAQGFAREEAYARISLNELYLEQGQYKQALADGEAGLALARQYQDSYLIGDALCGLAQTYLLMGDAQTAHMLLQELAEKAQSSGKISDDDCSYELTLGAVLLAQQRYEEAIGRFRLVEETAHKAGWKRYQLRALIGLAACHLAQEEKITAAQLSKQAVDLAQREHKHLLQLELRRYPSLEQIINLIPDDEQKAQDVPQTQETQNAWNIQIHQPTLRTLALGLPVVLRDEQPITRWRMAKTTELYFLLLDSERPLRKEQIITALWPTNDEQTDQAFRSAMHHLRRTIGEACIVHHSGVYELNLKLLYGDRVWYDVAVFQQLSTKGKQALASGNDEDAKQIFQEMLSLYRGDYLESFYSDWCSPRREDLYQIYMGSIAHLARICWRCELLEECLSYWHDLLKKDNCREDAHHGIMRCYYRQGKRTLAARQYQHYEKLLMEELSVTPGPAIQRLYQRIIQDT